MSTTLTQIEMESAVNHIKKSLNFNRKTAKYLIGYGFGLVALISLVLAWHYLSTGLGNKEELKHYYVLVNIRSLSPTEVALDSANFNKSDSSDWLKGQSSYYNSPASKVYKQYKADIRFTARGFLSSGRRGIFLERLYVDNTPIEPTDCDLNGGLDATVIFPNGQSYCTVDYLDGSQDQLQIKVDGEIN